MAHPATATATQPLQIDMTDGNNTPLLGANNPPPSARVAAFFNTAKTVVGSAYTKVGSAYAVGIGLVTRSSPIAGVFAVLWGINTVFSTINLNTDPDLTEEEIELNKRNEAVMLCTSLASLVVGVLTAALPEMLNHSHTAVS